MLIEHMTWEEYQNEVGRRVIILPVGSLEQHGLHLPLNVDVVIPKNLALMVYEELQAMVLDEIFSDTVFRGGRWSMLPFQRLHSCNTLHRNVFERTR